MSDDCNTESYPAPLSAAWLRNALRPGGPVIKSGKSPNTSATGKLSSALISMRDLYQHQTDNGAPALQRTLAARQLIFDMRRELGCARDALTRIKREYNEIGTQPPGLTRPPYDDRSPTLLGAERDLALVNSVDEGLQNLLGIGWFVTRDQIYLGEYNGWKNFANRLVIYFRIAMRSTNPHLAIGISDQGPIPRFVNIVVPEISGERPAVGYVAKFLKEAARTNRDNSAK